MGYDITGTLPGAAVGTEVIIELNGKTYTSNMLSLSGDFGAGVTAGPGKRIIWNHPRDFPEGIESVFICRVNEVPDRNLINEAATPSEGFRNAAYAVNRQTVTDSRTHLMWVRNGDLLPRPMRFADARIAIERLNRERFAGYTDWRIPSRDDFEGLVYWGRKNGWGYSIGRYISDYLTGSGFTGIQPGNYWSATADQEDSGRLFVANSWNGITRPLPAVNYYYLLPVRTAR